MQSFANDVPIRNTKINIFITIITVTISNVITIITIIIFLVIFSTSFFITFIIICSLKPPADDISIRNMPRIAPSRLETRLQHAFKIFHKYRRFMFFLYVYIFAPISKPGSNILRFKFTDDLYDLGQMHSKLLRVHHLF